MDNFQIETAQNISIAQNVAGVGERILAFLIDGLIMLSYVIIMSLIMSAVNVEDQWVLMMVLGLPLLLYFLLWETFWDGRSPGKASLDLRVVKLNGANPAFSDYLVRWLLRSIDITFSSGSVAVVSILLNGKGQRLGDLAAGTTVISERAKVGLSETLLAEVPDDYRPVYPQVTVLSDHDVQEIKMIYQDSLKHSNFRVIQSLASRVSGLLEVEPEERPVQFLGTVLKDYNYFTQR